jgi:hypothetical protein
MSVYKAVWGLNKSGPVIRLLIKGLVTFHEEFTITLKTRRRKLVVMKYIYIYIYISIDMNRALKT